MACFQLAVLGTLVALIVQAEVLKSNSGNVRTKRAVEHHDLFLQDGCQDAGVSSTFSEDQKTWTMEYHNAARKSVSASNMNKLVWDDKLACQAQRLVDTCRWGHDNVREYNGANIVIGQNIIASKLDKYFSELDKHLLTTSLSYFFVEQEHYQYPNVSCDEGTVCDHYRMMMMSFQRKVGGACRFCDLWTNNQGFHDYTNSTDHVLFCAFDFSYPMSSLAGKQLYKTGAACSQCEYEHYECQDGLCVDCHDNQDNNPNCIDGNCKDSSSSATCDYVEYYKTHYNYDLCPQVKSQCQKTCGLC